jgi:hypothetical protein
MDSSRCLQHPHVGCIKSQELKSWTIIVPLRESPASSQTLLDATGNLTNLNEGYCSPDQIQW